MKHNLYPLFIEKLKDIYGLKNENTNYLYKYLSIRISVFHNKRKINKRDLFNFIVEELNLTLFRDEKEAVPYLIYDNQKYSTFELSSEILDNMTFRAEMEGDVDYKEELEEVFVKGYRKAYKFRGLSSYKNHLTLQRLNILNQMFGADPVSTVGIEGFETDATHNPFKRSLEERLEAELKSDEHRESNTTSYITEEDLEDYLVENLELIEEGMRLIKRQVDIPGGVIDILARDSKDEICVIEIKTKEDKSLIWQTLHYPKEIKNMYRTKNVRMITVAPEYSKPIYDALKAVGNVETLKYDIKVASGNISDLKVDKY